MFIEDLKNDFYNVLLGKRVLLIVHYDVDAVCACKILLDLFKCDNIAYTLVPVGSITELKSAYEENKEEVKFVVLINCGGNIDLVDLLQPDEDVVFFVLDAHKPTDVCNVYSDGQVRLVYKDPEEEIPNFDDIFRDDEEDESESVGSLEEAADKKRARREWELRRDELMFNYTQFSYLGKPSGYVMSSLSRLFGRATCGAWAGGVAVAAREEQPALLQHVLLANNTDTSGRWRVVLEQDVCLPLYRQWSLEAALRHCPRVGPALKLHSLAGGQRVNQLLTEMGYPLAQARQEYRSMSVELRHGLVTSLESCLAARVTSCRVSRLVAVLRRAHSPPLSAPDLALIIQALIEQSEPSERAEGFRLALLSLSEVAGAGEEARRGGAERARHLLAVARDACGARQMQASSSAPYHLHLVPQSSGIPGAAWLAVSARWWRRPQRPLVAALEGSTHTLLYGMPPQDDSTNNLFGAAFEQAASRSGCELTRDHMDPAIVTVPNAQRTQFLDALTDLLS